MTDEYRLFIRDNAITAEQALFNLRNALYHSGIYELDLWWERVERMRSSVSNLTRTLEHMGRDNEEQE